MLGKLPKKIIQKYTPHASDVTVINLISLYSSVSCLLLQMNDKVWCSKWENKELIFSFYILKVITLKPGKNWISVLLCFEYGMNNSSLTHRLLTFLRFLTVHQLHWNVQSHKQIWKTFCTELQNIIFFSANLCFK